LKISDFDYDLPPEYIAQTPVEPRDAARLMVLHRETGKIEHSRFAEIGSFLEPGDLLVLNDTRVIPGRLYCRKLPGGGKVELLLLRRKDGQTWEALVGGKGLSVGRRLLILGRNGEATGGVVEVLEDLDGARRLVRFDQPVEAVLEVAGHVPLPPYIHVSLQDPERYQTVYARYQGSAAAPTAGLHFTPRLMKNLLTQGISFSRVTLHIGLDTFAPVTEADPLEHCIHSEWCSVGLDTIHAAERARQAGRRVVAVGTTSARALESAAYQANSIGTIEAYDGQTSLYITPGFHFRVVDALVTNFHLPRSTLILLVSAFAGREQILQAYETAKQEGYRFYSFGDAMLIL
jgi:S-adenosylmethionine:tRNA ribosyltransferase-isomerase